jgi:hypothetical protein
MIVTVIAFCLFVVLPSPLLQNKGTHPDLSGTWVLVPSKSNFGSTQKDTTDYIVTIIQQEPEIKIIKKYKLKGIDHVEQWSYYTDGRPQGLPVKGLDITTRWRGRKLYSSSHVSSPIDTSDEDEWELSNDGMSLTRTRSRSFFSSPTQRPQEPSKEKYVFTRIKQP